MMKLKPDIQQLLNDITELSHEFGTTDYVRGGGGNTSVKNHDTLWVKPSGTTLSGLAPETFVALDRKKISALYSVRPPEDSAAREQMIAKIMADAVLSAGSGRASVEAPLHNLLKAVFVIHNHPALVNGMTCAKNGAKVCEELFPNAIWLDYVNPGYTLCMHIHKKIAGYTEKFGKEPSVIFLKNHGVFVAGDTKQEIRGMFREIFNKLAEQYKKAGITKDLKIMPLPDANVLAAAERKIREALGDCFLKAGGLFDLADGPISPDHILYAGSHPFIGEPTTQKIGEYNSKYGRRPPVAVFDNVVFGIGRTQRRAEIALEFAQDAALVKKFAEAFGGVDFMTEDARLFIENWEAESYRSKQI